jgi:CheY-like chemotaxis protein
MPEKKKILIIDDEEMHLYTAKGLLESEGVEVSTYRGAFGATNSVRAVQPDLILLDVNMPALSGENLVSLIKPYSEEKKIPILFYSSNDEAMLRDLVAIHGVRGYVCKGDIPGLYEKVNQCLSSRGAGSAPP